MNQQSANNQIFYQTESQLDEQHSVARGYFEASPLSVYLEVWNKQIMCKFVLHETGSDNHGQNELHTRSFTFQCQQPRLAFLTGPNTEPVTFMVQIIVTKNKKFKTDVCVMGACVE